MNESQKQKSRTDSESLWKIPQFTSWLSDLIIPIIWGSITFVFQRFMWFIKNLIIDGEILYNSRYFSIPVSIYEDYQRIFVMNPSTTQISVFDPGTFKNHFIYGELILTFIRTTTTTLSLYWEKTVLFHMWVCAFN